MKRIFKQFIFGSVIGSTTYIVWFVFGSEWALRLAWFFIGWLLVDAFPEERKVEVRLQK